MQRGRKREGPKRNAKDRRKAMGRTRIPRLFTLSCHLSSMLWPTVGEGPGYGPAWPALNLTSPKDRRCGSIWQDQAKNENKEAGWERKERHRKG